MKRHPAFHLLSHEHHEGLLLAIRLQQGERALPRLWSHDRPWQAAYVRRFYDDQLQRHFLSEEEMLFPLAEGKSPAAMHQLTIQLREDHAWMRTLVAQLAAADAPQLEGFLLTFGKRLQDHIRNEERNFFPMCERWFTPGELASVSAYLTTHHPPTKTP
jgi:iron-sulfur cluster repair protein YtfE (RIC family)